MSSILTGNVEMGCSKRKNDKSSGGRFELPFVVAMIINKVIQPIIILDFNLVSQENIHSMGYKNEINVVHMENYPTAIPVPAV
ncbi:hypothetical protein [Providencia rettgeri]|uniref:Uncharacterized protein n=2 Tax=Providencia rettgeri TaxID=587 RepID=A0AAJ6FXZ9_PRORE|nr:hypothetical protein [Providencia rettgeri]WHT81767.1 hypothetical protein KOL65_20435 [Providencia rettgeri]WHT95898.1 hypothetical protein KOF27_20525 [Providencia rettgeri]WJM88263.1 hypothetical protein KOL64_20955 [Providencia rettgeri]